MATTTKKILEYLQTIETTYTDCRVLSQTELRVLVWFFLYGENVFSQVGLSWRGCSFRQSMTTCLLVVKASRGDIPLVAFCTDRTPIGCVLAFCKNWHADKVAWTGDKYA